MVKKVWRTDGRTDRQTDWTSHIAAWSQVKKTTPWGHFVGYTGFEIATLRQPQVSLLWNATCFHIGTGSSSLKTNGIEYIYWINWSHLLVYTLWFYLPWSFFPKNTQQITHSGKESSVAFISTLIQVEHQWDVKLTKHYSDVILSAMASQITGESICSNVCWGSVQMCNQSSAPLVFLMGIRRTPVDSPYKGLVTRKMFPFDDVIMRRSTFLHRECAMAV